jgi:lauroyl/myristoyl acyltransferase
MTFFENRANIKQLIDYNTFLPIISKMPLPVGQRLAQARGWIHGLIDYDWRSQAVKQYFVRDATKQAMQALMPDAGKKTQLINTLRRFVHNSREEWESYLFRNEKVMSSIFENSHIEGLEPLIAARGKGLVLLTCHLDSFCMGIALMGMGGLRINAMTTSAFFDPRVPPVIQTFFRKKIQGMEMHMQGGKLKDHETSLSYFYKALSRGESVVIQADIPAAPHADATIVPFLGGMHRMSVGAQRLALKTNSLVAAYVCLQHGVGKYKVLCLPPKNIDPACPEKSLAPFYQFLETHIRQFPDRWLAADLFRVYENVA